VTLTFLDGVEGQAARAQVLAVVIVSGAVSACLLTLLVLPVMYQQWTRWQGRAAEHDPLEPAPDTAPAEG
jgi:hypothetical protein